MIQLNPEQESYALLAIRLARETVRHTDQTNHVVSVWASFRDYFVSVREFLERVTKHHPHLYATLADAIEHHEAKWRKTEGVTQIMLRARR